MNNDPLTYRACYELFLPRTMDTSLDPWTFSTIGSTNRVAVDVFDDWECRFGPWMDVSDEWEIKMDERNDWETENVSQSFETSTRPTK